jgi:hypothetical protein
MQAEALPEAEGRQLGQNPYARYVNGEDARTLVQAYPAKLNEAWARLGESGRGRRPAPGKWTASEILCHLADCEIAFSFRWRQTLADDAYVAQPFDQDRWAPRYAATDGEDALRTFLALRAWNGILLEQLEEVDWARKLVHPELGELTFKTLVEITAGHDLNHLAQLNAIAAQPCAP